MLQTELAALLSQLHLSAPAQTLEKLELYWERVKQAPINLTAIKTDADAALLHFADSLAPLAFDFIADHAKLIDVGTGGGFPAVPLAVMRDDISVTAMDATRKKSTLFGKMRPYPISPAYRRAQKKRGTVLCVKHLILPVHVQ
jgi:16S rRNA G527 N7-methylase RsmG